MVTKTEFLDLLSQIAKKDVQNLKIFYIGLLIYITVSVFNILYSNNKYFIVASSLAFVIYGAMCIWKKIKIGRHYFRFMSIAINLEDFNFLEVIKIRAMDYDNEFNMKLVRTLVAKTILEGGYENE